MIKNFEYFAPKTVEEALTLLSQYLDECKIIAGGQSLLILMKQGIVAPKYLIDIKGISALDYINRDGKKALNIGSLTTHRAIETSQAIRDGFNVLAEMERNLAAVDIRNWGTIGGNLCHADPAGDVCPVLIALGGTLSVASLRGERKMTVEEFSTGYLETVLQPDEMLTEIQLPNLKPRTGVVYKKFNIIKGDYATASAAVSITINSKDEKCDDVKVVLGAVGSVAIRAKRAEKVLVGKEIKDELVEEAAQIASEEAEPVSDMHASEKYKRWLVRVLVKRVTQETLEKAKKA